MSHPFDALTEEALHGYLTGAAVERGEQFIVERRGDEWVAEFRSANPLAGEVVPMGDQAAILPDEIGTLGVNGPDRRTAMARLADLITDAN